MLRGLLRRLGQLRELLQGLDSYRWVGPECCSQQGDVTLFQLFYPLALMQYCVPTRFYTSSLLVTYDGGAREDGAHPDPLSRRDCSLCSVHSYFCL